MCHWGDDPTLLDIMVVVGEFPLHKGPVTRKSFQFNDIIMTASVTNEMHPLSWE